MEDVTDESAAGSAESAAPPRKPKRTGWKVAAALFGAVLILTGVFFAGQHKSVNSLLHPEEPAALTDGETAALDAALDAAYPDRTEILHALPYNTVGGELAVNAEAAILIDFASGDVLFEKNADEQIPPASMTKLVEMYVVFEACERGEVSLDDVVPLPPESWARNLPSDSSIMFLGEGQHVTLRELLLGLSVASGNDASIAVAYYVAGSMDAFVARMNSCVESMGLTRTHFVESSGYSAENLTTAREFAAFCRRYVERFPFALRDFHSQRTLRYPLKDNQPEYMAERVGDSQAVLQYNTNRLLGHLEGCDGLKTGFIYESGYNLALTAERGGVRYISVTMRGPGRGSAEGNRYRVADANGMMEYAFSEFAPYVPEEPRAFTVGVAAADIGSVRLVPARDERFSVPFIAGDTPADAASRIEVTAALPEFIEGAFEQGEPFGSLTYTLDGMVLNTIPLVADRAAPETGALRALWGRITSHFAEAAVRRSRGSVGGAAGGSS